MEIKELVKLVLNNQHSIGFSFNCGLISSCESKLGPEKAMGNAQARLSINCQSQKIRNSCTVLTLNNNHYRCAIWRSGMVITPVCPSVRVSVCLTLTTITRERVDGSRSNSVHKLCMGHISYAKNEF